MTRFKQGIPALAYCDPDDASPLLLRFIVKTKPRIARRNESRAQATLCLESFLYLDGYDDEQMFILQYDATNIAPGEARIENALILLPQEQLDQVSRGGNPQLCTLSLVLKEECSVWCRRADAPRKPRPGEETRFSQLAKLARARKLYILFDYNQLHQNLHGIFMQLVQHPEELNNYPVDQYYREQGLIHVDRSALGAKTADADVTAGDDTEDEAWPPAYTQEPLGLVSTHKTRSLLSHEDVSLSPCASACTSSKEKDSRATLSSAPSLDGSAPSPRFPPLARLSPGPPHSPFDTSLLPIIQDAIVRLVNAVLPDVVDCRLPSILKELVDTNALSDDSQESLASRTSVPPPIRKLSELCVLLGKDTSYEVERNMKRIYEHVLRDAAHLRREADVAFLEDMKLATSQLDQVAETKLEKFQELCGAHVERRKQEMEELRDNVLQHVAAKNERLERENLQLKRKNKELRQDQRDLRRYLWSMRVETNRRETQWKRERRRRGTEPQTKLPKTLLPKSLPKKMQEKLREKKLSAQKLRKPDDL